MIDLPQILILVGSDPLQAIEVAYAAYMAGKLSKGALTKISNKLKEVQKEKRFGFTPSEELASKLIKIDSTPYFTLLRNLIGKHPDLKLVRIGLYLEQLNKEGANDVVEETRSDILENHGPAGMKILRLGSSGLLSEIISYLSDLKQYQSLTQRELIDEYQFSVRKLEDVSIWPNNKDVPENIKLRIKNKMQIMRPRAFFLIATGRASKNSAFAIASLIKENSIRERGYMVFQPKTTDFGDVRKQFVWTFNRFVE